MHSKICIQKYCNFRWDKVHVFAPQSKAEITAIRNWLVDKLPNFGSGSPLWLGFERPRYCNGTGRISGIRNFFEQWGPGECGNLTAMKDELFSPGEPNNAGNDEFCVLSRHEDDIVDIACSGPRPNLEPYAVCEINLDFELLRSHVIPETTVTSTADVDSDENVTPLTSVKSTTSVPSDTGFYGF